MKPIVSIVILTYNQLEYTKACLASLPDSTSLPYELILVDNQSSDGTQAYLADYQRTRNAPERPVIFVDNGKNYGFAKGCNIGMRVATAPYICLLNNDTVLTSNWLEQLVDCLEQAPDAEVVGPYTDGMYPPMYVESRDQLPGGYQAADTLYGYCMLFRRSLLDRIGGLDELYGIGNFEDVDFVERVLRNGGKLYVDGTTYIQHKHHASWDSAFKLKMLVAKNLQRFKGKWGYGDGFDGGFAERPIFRCAESVIVPVPRDAALLAPLLDQIEQGECHADEWVFVDAYADESLTDRLNLLRTKKRLLHIQTCNEQLTQEQQVQIGICNAFGDHHRVEII